MKERKLIDIIEKPYWDFLGGIGDDFAYSPETLEPDLISIIDSNEHRFIIFDAKYYCPMLEIGKAPQNVPGIGDITKQYLNELAYKDFITVHSLSPVVNCFLIPSAGKDVISKGHIVLNFLRMQGLQSVQIRMLPAEKSYELYLSGKKMQVSDLKLDESNPSVYHRHAGLLAVQKS